MWVDWKCELKNLKSKKKKKSNKLVKGRYASINNNKQDFSGSPVVKNRPASAGDTSLILVLGRSHVPWGDEAHRHSCRAHRLQLLKPAQLEPVLCKQEKTPAQQVHALQLESNLACCN